MPSIRRPVRSHSTSLPLRTTTYRTPRLGSSGVQTQKLLIPRLPPSKQRGALPGTFHTPVITADTLALTLPVPPSINHQYATVNGRRLLSSTGRAYKAQVGQQVWIALAQSATRTTLQHRLQSGPLALSIQFFFASALRRDLDGGLKIAQDAICEGLGLNDNRIIETHLYKYVDKANPRIEVSLALIPPPPLA